MNKTLNIVILGAGYAGVHAAKVLSKKYKKNDSIKITLIDKLPYHTLMTELHEVAGGRVEPESVKVDLRKVFHKSKVNIVTEEVTKIDIDGQKLITDYAEYSYDYLIIGTGSEPAFFGVPGVKENAFTLWSLKDALEIKAHIKDMFSKASKERNDKKRQAMLTFAVAGAGFTGIEMVGELVEWKKKLAKEYNVDEKEVKLMVIEAMGRILNILDEKNAIKTERYLNKKGVEILVNAPIVEVTEDTIVLKNGKKIPSNTLIWTCGVQGNSFNSNLGLSINNRGRLNANEFMQSLDKENVYVVGDCAFLEEGESKTLPQIVEAAEQTAATAAHNIIASIENKEKKAFKSNYHGFMVSVGSHYAVANLNGIKLSGFFAMLMKHMVNLYYLFGVGGFYLVIKYLTHEFFDMKDRRSFVGGHLAAKSHSIWLVFLRVYMGILWFLEGFKKFVGEQTWENAKGLRKFTAGMGDDSWFKAGNVKMPFDWLKAAGDATSGASAAADTAASASQAAEGAASAWGEPIMNMPGFFKAIMKVLIPSPEVAVWFQRMVCVAEMGIGLLLIAGLFTWLASAASAFLVVNFILSGMAEWDILWYFFGATALMAGAGRALGLDYFVMPWLQKLLSNYWVGKQKPLYIKE
ncbi:FAD-dependent oxidoreductase [Clostridium thermarum]|uniref:FAD-dependent oxidoreductase n=1 Tax=Clostridium thermarum TaxID=1716543 RepID=UPI001120A8C4|nr:FAD-dependent oxidoreductase [Clostridium thermarum]